jgi:hypothetical protein
MMTASSRAGVLLWDQSLLTVRRQRVTTVESDAPSGVRLEEGVLAELEQVEAD